MAATERVQKLKLLIGGLEEPHAREFIKAPSLCGGLPRGIIVELLGPARTEWFIQLLKLHPTARTFWAEKEQRVLPTSLAQRGLNLNLITFGVFPTDMTTGLRRVIQSQLFQFVMAPNHFSEIRVFKAFQLFTEKSNCVLFLLGDKAPSTAWPISMQLEIFRGPENDFHIEVLKQKHRQDFL